MCGKVASLDLKESRRFYMMYGFLTVVQNGPLNGQSIESLKQLIHQSSSAPVEEVASASGQLLRVFSRSYNTGPETKWKTCLISLNSMKEERKWRRR